jgi:hypothetical protein
MKSKHLPFWGPLHQTVQMMQCACCWRCRESIPYKSTNTLNAFRLITSINRWNGSSLSLETWMGVSLPFCIDLPLRSPQHILNPSSGCECRTYGVSEVLDVLADMPHDEGFYRSLVMLVWYRAHQLLLLSRLVAKSWEMGTMRWRMCLLLVSRLVAKGLGRWGQWDEECVFSLYLGLLLKVLGDGDNEMKNVPSPCISACC